MIKLFPIALVVALAAFYAALKHLNQSIENYFDFVAFMMVIGGTTAVWIVIFPWEYRKDALKSILLLFTSEKARYRTIIQQSLYLVQNGIRAKDSIKVDKRSLSGEVFSQGLELISLSFTNERFESIMRERIYHSSKRRRRVANSLRSLAKYPPAFGLAGTVLGLVNIMRGLNNGLDAKHTALEMAVALVATFYGLLASNLLINPAGELILKKAQEEEEVAEIALQALLLINSGASPLEAQEMLNSFVPLEERGDILEIRMNEVA